MALEDFPSRDLEEQLAQLEKLRKIIDDATTASLAVFRAGHAPACDLAVAFEEVANDQSRAIDAEIPRIKAAIESAEARERDEEASQERSRR